MPGRRVELGYLTRRTEVNAHGHGERSRTGKRRVGVGATGVEGHPAARLTPHMGLPAALLALTMAATEAHPQDGPDADVRISISDERVRVAVVVNLVFADEVVELPREDDESLHPAEYEAAREVLYEFFSEANSVEIDGVLVTPLDGGFEVLPPDTELLPHFPRFGTRAMTKLRLLLDYPTKAPPARVEMRWGPYPPDYVLEDEQGIPPLEVIAFLQAGAQRERIVFTEDTPRHAWRASDASRAALLEVPAPALGAVRRLPVVSIVLWFLTGLALARGVASRGSRKGSFAASGVGLLAGFGLTGVGVMELESEPPELSREQALAVFEPLHANIYRAFDYADESDVYDALARSVEGDLLDELYSQIRASLIDAEQGGAVSEVQEVRPLEVEVESTGSGGGLGFQVVTRWQVDGAVFHWGHSHWRTNEYRARYRVGATEDGWRILEDEVLEQRRVDAGPLPAPGARDEEPEVREF